MDSRGANIPDVRVSVRDMDQPGYDVRLLRDTAGEGDTVQYEAAFLSMPRGSGISSAISIYAERDQLER